MGGVNKAILGGRKRKCDLRLRKTLEGDPVCDTPLTGFLFLSA